MFLLWVSLLACTNPSTSSQAKVSELNQSKCSSSSQQNQTVFDPTKRAEEKVTLTLEGTSLRVAYSAALFRCEQQVIFEVAESGTNITITALPKEMNPTTVARCMCSYDLSVKVGPFNAGQYTVKVQRKSDNYGSPSTTADIHSESITIK